MTEAEANAVAVVRVVVVVRTIVVHVIEIRRIRGRGRTQCTRKIYSLQRIVKTTLNLCTVSYRLS